ncbi:ABC1 kinase family protein [Paragemmobacter ruber]|uniref:AarF/ABC1/UbiB kinase family protein n=1 Tax=Paragemmobacter ruber TaxID=1985673 RepID=A0ABW9Y298_9RHOB|nr:AarF/ABC1/UbiB kinase family protein [Rhodobacter ruber]NBE06624.1 AarF/ABC1/UbiB kinase family protein [Rhodobacter ruber]
MDEREGKAVPAGRVRRMMALGGLATGIGGRVLAEGALRLAQGERPRLGDLILTPANARRVTDQLAQLRGAAMKVGQLLSMDAGEMLPSELSAILARLRADAEPMPPVQLRRVLDRAWGVGWLSRFRRFDVRPVASASIGQVHRAQTKDGRDLAIKVQYPGVRASIDSDVDNVAALLRLSGLVPGRLDVGPLLAEAKRQLHEEADYRREAAQMRRFGALLDGRPGFVVPVPQNDLSGDDVLAMDYLDSQPIESLENAEQSLRDRVAARLIGLVLEEVFVFNLMQTDPNFANFRWQAETGRIVLLDFGAARSFSPGLAPRLRAVVQTGIAGEPEAMLRAMVEMGYLPDGLTDGHRRAVLELAELAFGPLRKGGIFDFGQRDLVMELRDRAMALGMDPDLWHVPPPEVLFLHRKFGGLYLLASRLRARVDLDAVMGPYFADCSRA